MSVDTYIMNYSVDYCIYSRVIEEMEMQNELDASSTLLPIEDGEDEVILLWNNGEVMPNL